MKYVQFRKQGTVFGDFIFYDDFIDTRSMIEWLKSQGIEKFISVGSARQGYRDRIMYEGYRCDNDGKMLLLSETGSMNYNDLTGVRVGADFYFLTLGATVCILVDDHFDIKKERRWWNEIPREWEYSQVVLQAVIETVKQQIAWVMIINPNFENARRVLKNRGVNRSRFTATEPVDEDRNTLVYTRDLRHFILGQVIETLGISHPKMEAALDYLGYGPNFFLTAPDIEIAVLRYALFRTHRSDPMNGFNPLYDECNDRYVLY